jgi:anti-sigma regulatory factor (Ser/Thr protein kinase)
VPATLRAPERARRAVDESVGELVPPELVSRAELLVTELITNAVRHGGLGPGDEIDVGVVLEGSSLRVEVADRGPGFDPPPEQAPHAEPAGGWGLMMMSRFSSRWGVSRGTPNVAWFEIDLPRPAR